MSPGSDRPTYLRIKRKLVTGCFSPGGAINVKKLEEEISSSQVPIREALIKLSGEGLVDFVPGKGFFAKSNDFSELVGSFDMMNFFFVDAASHICSNKCIRSNFGAECEIGMSRLRGDGDLFDHASSFLCVLCGSYRQPHLDIMNRLLYRCVNIISIDANLNDDCIYYYASRYLDLIRRGKFLTAKRGVDIWFRERKLRLANTLLYADNKF